MLAALTALVLASCSTPLHTWDVATTSTPRSPGLDAATVSSGPIATLGVVAPAALQGFTPVLSHALTTALAASTPPVRAIPTHETFNRLNESGLTATYDALITGFARHGILERAPLQQIAAALGARYVLQPGLAAFEQAVGDKFEVFGLKVIKTRLTTLRVWLQLWDSQTGRMLWESSGEITVAAQLLTQESSVSLDDIAERLWARMIREDLLAGETRSRLFFSK
jgi:hypothetical protein